MLFSRSVFDERIKAGTLRLAHIGMSNIGKTHRADDLTRERDFAMVSVDAEIEKCIERELPEASIAGMAAWMGFPYDARYAGHEARYLALEEAVMRGVTPTDGQNFVLDTTGSVIYLPSDVHTRLREEYLIVHIEASEARIATLVDRYFAHPKPVVWGDAYRLELGEEPMAALRRCYPDLLTHRLARYRALADVTVPSLAGTDRHFTADEFIDAIRTALPA